MGLREDADRIIAAALRDALPDVAVRRELERLPEEEGRLVVVAIGKAAWQMAAAACDTLGKRIDRGVVVTKYGHLRGELTRLALYEAGHPVPDENSCRAAQAALDCVSGLTREDRVLFLVSGGGSALFEKPLIAPEELADITRQLLACGADITEINTLRKRFSAVKGGRFAQRCAPARVLSILLSDVLGDPPDMIASGPAYPDSTTCAQAMEIAERYGLRLSDDARRCLSMETPKALSNVETRITGSVRQLCDSAERVCAALGYEPVFLTDRLSCEAREAGAFLAAIARSQAGRGRRAFILGGETVVHLTGDGLGGRNQELALSAARGMDGLTGALLFSVGSDGTDGPTDAAGGWVDGNTAAALREKGIDIEQVLARNDAYRALQACGGLITTGPTGTNVNDLTVLLVE